jgi:hypothetical protein
MNKSYTTYRILFTAFCFLFFSFFPLALSAQCIEVHLIKDFSTNKTANNAWGGGGALHFDQFVKKTTFSIKFDWTTYRKKSSEINPRYNRISGGILAFYSVKIYKKISLQCGAEANYTNLKYSYRYGIEELDPKTEKLITLQQTGHFIGIGPLVGFNYELSPRFAIKFNFIPNYLISVGSKSSLPAVEPEYSKGIWLFPIQLGVTYKLFNSEQ